MTRTIRLLVIFSLFCAPLKLQEHEPEQNFVQDSPVFSVGVELVSVPVVALNRRGRPLGELTKDSFKVYEKRGENGTFIEREIDTFTHSDKLPLRAGVLIDTSGSVQNPEQFRYQKDVASEIVKLIFTPLMTRDRDNKVFVAEFSYESMAANPTGGMFLIKQDWTNNPRTLIRAISRMKPLGLTPLFISIEQASGKFKEEVGEFATVLIVISDGYNNLPFSSLSSSVSAAQSAHLPVYTIGTTIPSRATWGWEMSEEPKKNLLEIAAGTGGRFFQLPSLKEVIEVASRILSDLDNRYYLEYKLNAEYEKGDNIEIKVEIGSYDKNNRWRSTKAQLLHRSGYIVNK
ncbi:MAG: VWA domain-containing protein [Candidatus Paceibacterota bacterium]